MLGWITRLFRRSKPVRQPSQTFEFWDGWRWRSIDPVEAWAALDTAAGGNWTDLMRTVAADPPAGLIGPMAAQYGKTKQEASVKLANAVCAAFGVDPYRDGQGLTIPERIDLAGSYLDHMARLAAAARPFGPSPSPTAASPTA